jgi:inositol phosphorylceramide mannosyltransferase catalytic subunit
MNKVKLIHFIWVDKNNIGNDNVFVPQKYLDGISKWKELYADWTIKLWKGSEILHIINNINSDIIKKTFYNYKHFICKLDFVRFLILYLYGGLYLDCDTYCHKKYDFTKHKSLVLIKEPENNVKKNYPGYDFVIINGYMYSDKNNPNLLKILDGFINRQEYEKQHILLATGPAAMRHIYDNLDKKQIDFIPHQGFITDIDNGYSYTTYDNTWCS